MTTTSELLTQRAKRLVEQIGKGSYSEHNLRMAIDILNAFVEPPPDNVVDIRPRSLSSA